jgi:hypothetical protein
MVANPGFQDIGGKAEVNELTFGPLPGWDLYESSVDQTNGGAGPVYFIGTLGPRPLWAMTGGVTEFFPGGAREGDRVGTTFNFNSGGDGGNRVLCRSLLRPFRQVENAIPKLCRPRGESLHDPMRNRCA